MTSQKIFVLDDEPDIVKFIEKALVKNGYRVESSASAFQALEKTAVERYDVIITDLRMPEMSGMELLEKIKAAGVKSEVVVVTAHATIDTAVECLRKGAADYLIKPFEIRELLASVEKAIKIGDLKSRLVTMEEMDKIKDDFIATITHELKTPLMAISGATELLGMMTPAPAAAGNKSEDGMGQRLGRRQLLEIIARQTGKMKSLIEDILDFARLDAGKLEIKKVPVSLAEITAEVLSEVRPLADAKGITIVPPSEDSVARCDREQIKRAVTNLLTNAVKYNNPGGRINVAISPAPDYSATLSVADDGIGLDPGYHEKIFEKFFRVDQSLRREAGGFGLGLSIVKKIVELHGGNVGAASDGLGKGTTVSFTIPV